MSVHIRSCARAAAVAMLCIGGQAARAQVAPVQYWIPGGPFGFGGSWRDAGNGANTYGDFPGFDAGRRGDDWRDTVPVGMFVRGQSGSLGLGGLGQAGAVGSFGALTYDSAVTGYNFKGTGNLPVTVYAGFDTLTYRPGLGSPLAPFSTDASIATGYSARAGIAFQPAANVTLSFEAGFTQQQTGTDSGINSALPFGRR